LLEFEGTGIALDVGAAAVVDIATGLRRRRRHGSLGALAGVKVAVRTPHQDAAALLRHDAALCDQHVTIGEDLDIAALERQDAFEWHD
jgi:hypothetical protein